MTRCGLLAMIRSSLVAAVYCIASAALAAEPRVDDRVPIDTKEHPHFSPVLSMEARFALEGGGTAVSQGTGFLIGDCHALTNRHVLHPDLDVKLELLGIKVSAGWTGKAPFSVPTILAAGEIVAIGYKPDKLAREEDLFRKWLGDWAILRLDRPIGRQLGVFAIRPVLPERAKGLPIQTAGFPGDKYQDGRPQLWGNLACTIDWVESHTWRADSCAGAKGVSGSPAIAKGRDGRYYAIAVRTYGNRDDHMSGFTPLSMMRLSELREILDAAPCDAFGSGGR